MANMTDILLQRVAYFNLWSGRLLMTAIDII